MKLIKKVIARTHGFTLDEISGQELETIKKMKVDRRLQRKQKKRYVIRGNGGANVPDA